MPPISATFPPSWQLDHLPDDPLKAEFETRAIMDFEQPLRHIDAEMRVSPDPVGINAA